MVLGIDKKFERQLRPSLIKILQLGEFKVDETQTSIGFDFFFLERFGSLQRPVPSFDIDRAMPIDSKPVYIGSILLQTAGW